MKKITSFVDIIDTWPVKGGQSRLRAFAADLGIKYSTAAVMKHRNRINPVHWDTLLRQRRRRGLRDLDHRALVRIAASRPDTDTKRRAGLAAA